MITYIYIKDKQNIWKGFRREKGKKNNLQETGERITGGKTKTRKIEVGHGWGWFFTASSRA